MLLWYPGLWQCNNGRFFYTRRNVCQLYPLLSSHWIGSLQEFCVRENADGIFWLHENVGFIQISKSNTCINWITFLCSRKEHQDIDDRKGRFGNYKSIKWSEPDIYELFTMYTVEPLSMQCNRSDGHRFPGFDWEGASITEVPILIPEPESVCSTHGKSLKEGECDLLGDCIY